LRVALKKKPRHIALHRYNTQIQNFKKIIYPAQFHRVIQGSKFK
jgi:hypothetical protein